MGYPDIWDLSKETGEKRRRTSGFEPRLIAFK
jgi:hypothetical protein